MQARGSQESSRAGKYWSNEPTPYYNASKVKAMPIAKCARIAVLNKCNTALGSRSKLVIAAAVVIVFVSAHISQHATSSYSLSHDRPRIILITKDYEVKEHDEITTIDVEGSGKIQQPWISEAKVKHGRENFEEKDCKAMHDWQVKSFPNCNNIHESDFLSYTHVNAGGWRDVWKAEDFNRDPYVVKSLIFQEDTEFRFRDAERHRRDANAYSMLHSSKHTMNIYGYCVNTATFDYSAGGDLEKMLGNDRLGNDHKLKYAWQFAKALSDVHSVGNIHDSAAISHADLSASQYLWFDGMFKLNDFNRARFIRWNTVKQEACPFYISYNPGLFRSPEEYREDSPLTEKIDVYSLGNIFWQLLTKSEDLFPDTSKHDAIKAVKRGHIQVEKEFEDSLNEQELAVLTAKKMCQRMDPLKRSTAMEVEQYLRSKLEEFNVQQY
mmetsp:Transcript_20399/g.30054  ORF Transcript_20399/g.30054 Transcript_20399/m.30054 type:complete len:438 (-) Transcript_20399:534-1847(-)